MRPFFIILFISMLLQGEELRIGYDNSSLSNYSKKDMKIATELWMTEFIQDIGYTVTSTFYDDPELMAADLNQGKLDYVTAFGLVFVKYFDLENLSDGFSGGSKNIEDSNFITLVSQNSANKDWKDLHKASIILQENDKEAELYVQDALLRANGKVDIELIPIRSRQRAVIQLFFGKADAAVVTLNTFKLAKELNPQIGKKLRIMENSGITSSGLGFFRKGLDPKAKKLMIESALRLDSDVRGRQMLALFQTESIIETKLEDLQPIKKLYERYMRLSKKAGLEDFTTKKKASKGK